MIKVFSMAIQTIFGATVLTCGVPADYRDNPPDVYHAVRYVCIAEVGGQTYAANGVIYRLADDGDKPKISFDDML